MTLAEYETRLAAALRAPDPVAAVQAFAPGADGDGVRLTVLLVARLRFERLLRGSRAADAWFAADPAAFARAFAAYHAAVAPRAFFPRDEAWLFFAWRRAAIPCARLRRRWPATRRI
jgi:hypothetical protein